MNTMLRLTALLFFAMAARTFDPVLPGFETSSGICWSATIVFSAELLLRQLAWLRNR
jgi:hypothetical protein